LQRKLITHNSRLFPPLLRQFFFSLKQTDLWQLWNSAGSKGDLQSNLCSPSSRPVPNAGLCLLHPTPTGDLGQVELKHIQQLPAAPRVGQQLQAG